MDNVTIVYGTTTGNTQKAAEAIAAGIGHNVNMIEASQLIAEYLESADLIILGTSTWGLGDIQDDWISALDNLKQTNLSGKQVAIFGMGDARGYPDTFVDGMRDLYDAAQSAGATLIGATDTQNHVFNDSRAVIDGSFIGLALDDDNAADQTGPRITQWIEQLKNETHKP